MMTNEYPYPQGCSEEYAELCALSTSGELTAEEWANLEEHLSDCTACTSLLQEYRGLVAVGMAKIAPDDVVEDVGDHAYSEKLAEQRLITALREAPETKRVEPVIALVPSLNNRREPFHFALIAGIAAALVIAIGGGYALGSRHANRVSQPLLIATTRQPEAEIDTDKARIEADRVDLQKRLTATQALLDEASKRSAGTEQQIAELTKAKVSLLAQIDDLTQKSQAASSSLLAANQQRDTLQQQLNDASRSLLQVKDDLSRAQQERQGAVLRVASLETQVNNLHATLAVADKSASTNEQFLSQDRDIRELMGARQLYIADVVDVQGNGERSKPFGRVFYTKGKSLIFYAFDLQGQPGYREAKAFQAWGKPESSSDRAISLGVFYMDSAANKRWVLKADNPAVLAQINAVFVTVEPQGGSLKPTGKPFLEAYLHTLPPNHP